MFEIKGKVNTAICYAKVVEDEAIEQIRRMCDYDFAENSKIRIMPDVHAGKGCTIYTTSVNEATLDEAPMAYKSLEDIIDVIKESVNVIEVMKPIYNFKAN